MCAGGQNDGRDEGESEGKIWRVRFTAGLELDMIGIGEYRACMTFDSGDGVKVGYKLLTA